MTTRLIKWGLFGIGLFIIGALCGLYVGSWTSWRSAMQAEYKVNYFNYKKADDNPQLREYLKSRMYFIACFLDKRDLEGFNIDLGPVDEKILSGISGIKGPESEQKNYSCAIAKHKK